MTQVRRVALILAPLALAAALFVALALAADAPADCPAFKHRRTAVTAIQAHGLGHGLTCARVRAALRLWIDRGFPHRAAGWRFAYRQDCACHVAVRPVPGGGARRFAFSS